MTKIILTFISVITITISLYLLGNCAYKHYILSKMDQAEQQDLKHQMYGMKHHLEQDKIEKGLIIASLEQEHISINIKINNLKESLNAYQSVSEGESYCPWAEGCYENQLNISGDYHNHIGLISQIKKSLKQFQIEEIKLSLKINTLKEL